ncbi:MAG: HAD family phosphatase [Actinomycetales bacterium]|nr:HAD family phosphatase [Actinomycetales bacterium]
MPERPGVDAVIFDYGGVMTNSIRSIVGDWLARDGIDPDSFSAAMRAWLGPDAPAGNPVHLLEVGELSIDEFDRLLAAQLRTLDASQVDPAGLSASLFAQMRDDETMFALVGELRAAGLSVGLLSNSWGNGYPRARIDEAFDFVVISGEVGMRKPDQGIYDHCLTGLGAQAAGAVFVDDAEQNVMGAQRLGMRTILHASPEATRDELRRMGLPVSAASTVTAVQVDEGGMG